MLFLAGDYFPPYFSGLALAISGSLIPEMYAASQSSLTHFLWVDDVFLTGILTQRIQNITKINIRNTWHAEKDFKPDATIMVHPSNAYRLWNRLLVNLLPSQVCTRYADMTPYTTIYHCRPKKLGSPCAP